MSKIDLNGGKFIGFISDDTIKHFLQKGVGNFFQELSKYINENNDEGIVHYANEMTMASLFVCGNLRNDPDMTGVQEYGTICTKNGKEVVGRPDIFMKSGKAAIWIECKYERNLKVLGDEHWDVPAWLKWDKENAFSQVETYYNSEKESTNNCYERHYLVTLCFKVIKENPDTHNKNVEEKLETKLKDSHDSSWYYQVGFMEPQSKDKSIGIEVFGTCYYMNPISDSAPVATTKMEEAIKLV